jgi:TonB family protein
MYGSGGVSGRAELTRTTAMITGLSAACHRVFRVTALLGCGLWLAIGGCAVGGPRPLELVSSGAVIYPEAARRDGIEGSVTVRYDVEPSGRVVNAQVVRAEPAGVFEQAALATVSSWRFRAQRGSRAATVTGVESRVQFSLRGGDAYRDY